MCITNQFIVYQLPCGGGNIGKSAYLQELVSKYFAKLDLEFS